MGPEQSRDQVRLWRHQLAVEAKCGINFIFAAVVIWLGIAGIWTLSTSAYNRSVLTFVSGSLLLPLAFLLSKVLKTRWTVPGNPLEPLGLWLNFAQLCYFPVLVYFLLGDPERFILGYAVITGAHLFPYAWFYDTRAYAVAGAAIPVGALLLELLLSFELVVAIPLFVAGALFLLGLALVAASRKKTTTS